MTPEDLDYSDEDFANDSDGEESEFDYDCGFDPTSGLCSMAGSEDCDFECPYRDELYPKEKP